MTGPNPAGRPKLWGAAGSRQDDVYLAEVDLSHEDQHTNGRMRAPAWQDLEYAAVARATLQALESLITGVDFLDGYLLRMAGGQVVIVVLRRQDEIYTGSAFVKRHMEDAIARATLDALNRVMANKEQ